MAARSYLVAYNFVQLAVWTTALLRLTTTLTRGVLPSPPPSSDIAHAVYAATQRYVVVGQSLAWLEVLHVASRLIRAPLAPTFIQCLGRYVILMAVIQAIPPIQHSPITITLFLAWSLADMLRYSMYIATLTGWSPPLLRWLRYSAFVILYPMGIGAEWWIYYSALPFVDLHRLYAVTLPNAWNFAFDFGVWNRIVLLSYLYFGPFMFFHMWRQRQAKLMSPLEQHRC